MQYQVLLCEFSGSVWKDNFIKHIFGAIQSTRHKDTTKYSLFLAS